MTSVVLGQSSWNQHSDVYIHYIQEIAIEGLGHCKQPHVYHECLLDSKLN